MADADFTITPAQQSDVITGLVALLEQSYVFPDIATQIAESLRERQVNHAYAAITSAATFCEAVTAEMQRISHDKHLCIFSSAAELPPHTDVWHDPTWRADYVQRMAFYNNGFFKVERLRGNIGYIDLRSFLDPSFAAETAIAAMNLVANTSALIVDLRHNDGGAPAMIALIFSYFWETSVHLMTYYYRATERTWQSWTLPYVPGARFGAKPVYVLTSSTTISGAEEFAYTLKHSGRGTVVGEVTAGAAHPGSTYQLTQHFAVIVPIGRSISLYTGTDWEGVGVIPDVEVLQEKALEVAYRLALSAVLDAAKQDNSPPFRQLTAEIQAVLQER